MTSRKNPRKKYIVTFSDGEDVRKIAVFPSVVKLIHDIQRAPNYDRDRLIILDDEHECAIKQIRSICSVVESNPLEDSTKLLDSIDNEVLDEKQMRDGWHRSMCAALTHKGVTKESPIIKRYCRAYDVDPDALYPKG